MSRRLVIRICALAAALTIFAVAWLTVAARPWQAEAKASRDSRLLALQEREARLRSDAREVRRLVEERWAGYRRDLRERNKAIAAVERRHQRDLKRARQAAEAAARAPRVITVAVPTVNVVNLPPVTKTKTS